MILKYFRNRRIRKEIKHEETKNELLETLAQWRMLHNLRSNMWYDDRALYAKSVLLPAMAKAEGFTLEEIGSSQEEMDKWATPRSEEGKEALAA